MPRDAQSPPILIADVGATHTRLAVHVRGRPPSAPATFANAEHAGLEPIVSGFLARHAGPDRPRSAALAVAGPVRGGEVAMTNLGWRVSERELRARFGFDAVRVLNDLCAVALAIPFLPDDGTLPIGAGARDARGAIGVLGPGTGLGVAGLVRRGDAWVPIAGEGGHVTLASRGDAERDIVARLERRFGHASAERALSGPGIENLYRCVAERAGAAGEPPAAAEISERAAGADPIAAEAMELFFLFLGTVAGDLALTLGATGGVYLAGGILPQLRGPLLASGFRRRFADKGRYRAYLEAIPVRLIVSPHPALEGLRHVFEQPAP